MTEQTENLVLEMRRMRASQERKELDISDLKSRMSSAELHLGQIMTLLGGLNQRIDRLDERVARIERRLDLAEA